MTLFSNKTKQRKRLLFFYSGTGQFRYGVAEVFRHVLNGLDKERYCPILVITGTLDGPIEGLSDDVEVLELHQVGLRRAFLPLVRASRQIRPHVIVSAMEHPNALTVLARIASRHRCKLVLTSHGVFTPRLQFMWAEKHGRMIQRMVRWTYPLADHVICVSEAVKSDLLRYVPQLVASSVIYNPVLTGTDLPEPNFNNKTKGLIVTSSRLQGFKKVDEAIRALIDLESFYHLVVLGDGPERQRLEALVNELGLSNRVAFEGYVDDPFVWYRKAEVFVLPSMWEGFGNVLIESMAYGCQVIANSEAYAPAEVLGHGEFGFLYTGGDSKALAATIQKAHKYPKSVDLLVDYAWKFTSKRAAGEYDAVFQALLHQQSLGVLEVH